MIDLGRVGGGQDPPVGAGDDGLRRVRLVAVAVDDGRQRHPLGRVEQVLPDGGVGRRRSAAAITCRPWTSRKLACAWATETAATATRTTSTMTSWRTRSWPARETLPEHAPPPAPCAHVTGCRSGSLSPRPRDSKGVCLDHNEHNLSCERNRDIGDGGAYHPPNVQRGKDGNCAYSRVGPSAVRRHGGGPGGHGLWRLRRRRRRRWRWRRAGHRAGDPGRHGAGRWVRPDGADRGQGHGGRQAGLATSRSRTWPAPAARSPSSGWSTRRATASSSSRWGWAWSAASTPTSPRPPWTRPRRWPGSPRSRRSSWSTRTPPTSRSTSSCRPGRPTRARSRSAAGPPPGALTTWPRC